jgi:hypothetical protein
VTGFPLVLTRPDHAFGLPDWPQLWRQSGAGWFSDVELGEWDDGMWAASDTAVVYALTFLVVSGRRP